MLNWIVLGILNHIEVSNVSQSPQVGNGLYLVFYAHTLYTQDMIDFGVSESKQQALQQRMLACQIQEQDLEERYVRSSGPGGQHVNKNATCVVLHHRPTGLQVKCQESRSQLLNRFYARRRLCELMEERTLGTISPEAKRLAKIKKQKDRRRRRRKTT